MRIIEGVSYPINYEQTLARAKKESEMGVAIENVSEIENRWIRLITCEGYTMHDLKKETLLMDIEELIRCCILFLNKIVELDALAHHRKPKGPKREARPFPRRED